MSDTATKWDIDGLNLDPSLLEELERLEPEPEPETDQEPESPEPEESNAEACDALAELIVDGFEMTVQTFGHERYALDAGKKALLVANYTKVLRKYENRTTHFLGQYTEEILEIGRASCRERV